MGIQTIDDKKKKVLIVDDEKSITDMFKMLLEFEGFDCLVANDALNALAISANRRPDLILSDINMPGKDGFYLRKQILSMEHLKNIPFVFLTSVSDDDTILRGYDLNIDEYILKSSSQKVIAEKVKTILKRREKENIDILNELKTVAEEKTSSLVAKEVPKLHDFEIFHRTIPFNDIPGGDFVDYVKVNENVMVIVVGDIMGKKWEAWFASFAFISYLRSSIRNCFFNSTNYDPAAVLKKVNDALHEDLSMSKYLASISLIVINNLTLEVSYSGAGDYPIIYKPKNNKGKLVLTDGVSLGLKENGEYSTASIKMNEGDSILVYTDGVIDATNYLGQRFGLDRVKKVLDKNNNNCFGDVVLNEVKEFTNNKLNDDTTIVGITCSSIN